MVRFSLKWYGMVWFGLVWFGLVWFGMVWYGMVWFGLVWFGMVHIRLHTKFGSDCTYILTFRVVGYFGNKANLKSFGLEL